MAADNKTEKATPRRRQKAREKGQVARSRDLSSTLALAGTVAAIAWTLPTAVRVWRQLFRSLLSLSLSSSLTFSSPALEITEHAVLRGIIPVMGCACLLAALSGVAQGGLVVAPSALMPSLDRLSPAKKLGQMFSVAGLANLFKSLVPFGAIAYCAVLVLVRDWKLIVSTADSDLGSFCEFLASRAFAITWRAVLILLLWSGLDYLLMWRKLESELSMSREDLRNEAKESEGHPTIKMRIRRLQRQASRRRTLQDVANATVVVTNPTHFAVALAYGPELPAPKVIAKGQNLLAQQIKEAARWHGIPIMENPPLAQALYRSVEVGDAIPAKLYAVVAELLALVYRAQQRATAARGGA